MRDDEDARQFKAAGASRAYCQIEKRFRDDEDGGQACRFEVDRVVETPRRARPSSAEADDDRVDGPGEGRQHIRFLARISSPASRVELENGGCPPTSAGGFREDIGENLKRRPRIIDADSKAAPAQRVEAGSARD